MIDILSLSTFGSARTCIVCVWIMQQAELIKHGVAQRKKSKHRKWFRFFIACFFRWAWCELSRIIVTSFFGVYYKKDILFPPNDGTITSRIRSIFVESKMNEIWNRQICFLGFSLCKCHHGEQVRRNFFFAQFAWIKWKPNRHRHDLDLHNYRMIMM